MAVERRHDFFKAPATQPASGRYINLKPIHELEEGNAMGEAASKVPVKMEDKKGERARGLQAWNPLEGLRREVDRLFDSFDRSFWPRSGHWASMPVSVPAMDIAEKPYGFEVTTELPGLAEKDVEVKVSDGSLIIRGEKQEETEEKDKNYFLQERRFGAFERSFSLPEGVDVDRIEASFRNGVLTVSMPKMVSEKTQAKSIPIKAA